MIKKLTLLALATLTLCACSSSSLDGDWDPMKWKAEQSMTKNDGAYIIPASGGVVSFACSNYSGPWLAGIEVDGKYVEIDYEGWDFHNTHGDWYAVSATSNKLSVSFDANTASERTLSVTVTAGDIFETFKFRQQAASR